MPDQGLTFGEMRRHLLSVIRSEVVDGYVVRAVPVAFPVVTSVFGIDQRLPVTLGLAHRFILEAVCRFGPLSIEEINSLLGLGLDVVQDVLRDIASFEGGVIRAQDRVSAGELTHACLTQDRFARVVRQQHRFVVNAVNGALLPVSFWDRRDDFRFRMVFERGTESVVNSVGSPVAIRAWLLGTGATGAQSVQEWIAAPDSEQRRLFGVPEGAFALASAAPRECIKEWTLAFALVCHDGSVGVVAAGSDPITLLGAEIDVRGYLRNACCGSAFSPWLVDPLSDDDDRRLSLPDGAKIVKGESQGELLVTVADPERELRYDIDAAAEDCDEQVRLRNALVDGVWWNFRTCGVHRLVPGNVPTAARVCLLQAIRALRRRLGEIDYNPTASPPFLLHDWWDSWQVQYTEGLNEAYRPPKADVSKLLDEASKVNDTEFLEKLDWIQEGEQ